MAHPVQSSGRSLLPLHAAGLAAAAVYGTLAVLSHRPAGPPIALYLILMAAAWAVLLAAFAFLRARPDADTRARAVPALLAWALLFRLCGLAAEPLYEDDHYRYLWDGRAFALTGSPYGVAPRESFTDPSVPPRFQVILDHINNPHLPTIYGPLTEIVFLAGYHIHPGALWPVKAVFILADLGLLLLVLRRGAPRHGLLFAWCPLLIQEVAFSAHPEPLAILLALAAFEAAGRRPVAAGALTALALGARLTAVWLAPFVLWRCGRRGGPRAALALAATLAALYAPFLGGDGAGGLGVTGLFLRAWEFNSTGFALLTGVFGREGARMAAGSIFLGVLAACLWRWRATPDAWPRGEWIYAALLVLSPVANPWYFLWILPFAALRPRAWNLTMLAVVALSYGHGLNLPGAGLEPYRHPAWVRPLEAVLVLTALIGDGLRAVHGRRPAAGTDAQPPPISTNNGT